MTSSDAGPEPGWRSRPLVQPSSVGSSSDLHRTQPTDSGFLSFDLNVRCRPPDAGWRHISIDKESQTLMIAPIGRVSCRFFLGGHDDHIATRSESRIGLMAKREEEENGSEEEEDSEEEG